MMSFSGAPSQTTCSKILPEHDLFRNTGFHLSGSCPGALLQRRLAAVRLVDTLLENSRWLEYHDAPRRDWHFFAGLWVSTDALAFLAHHEGPKGRQLHCFAALKTIGDFLEKQFDQPR